MLILCAALLINNACSSKQPQDHFANLLEDGYKVVSNEVKKPMILGFLAEKDASCFYGAVVNPSVKKRADSLYKLITREFNTSSMPIYVSDVRQCPANTSIFVYLHENLKNPEQTIYQEEVKLRNFLRNNQPAKLKKRQGLASITRIKGGKLGVVFVKINQLTRLSQQNKTYAKLRDAIVTEELFQAISNGNDIQKSNQRMSVLHEPARQQIPLPHPPDHSAQSLENPRYLSFFKTMLKEKPTGLCSYDLWFMILAKKAKRKEFVFYEQYLNDYKDNSQAIHQQAKKISEKPEYKHLFDPRCSGENRGKNTKIAINRNK